MVCLYIYALMSYYVCNIGKLKITQKMIWSSYEEVHEFIGRHSHINITIYIYMLYEWYIQKLNCSDNDRVWTKVFFSNFFHFWRVVKKSEFFFQISIIFQGHHMVILLDMIVLNHIVTLIMMFEEGVAAKHGK